jgi:hypothetical protein
VRREVSTSPSSVATSAAPAVERRGLGVGMRRGSARREPRAGKRQREGALAGAPVVIRGACGELEVTAAPALASCSASRR